MITPTPDPFVNVLAKVVQEIAPQVLAELEGWKFCCFCGSITNWAEAMFDAADDNLTCPTCTMPIREWPPGVPVAHDCGGDHQPNFVTRHGLPVCVKCDEEIRPSADYYPLPQDKLISPPPAPQPLRFAECGPGVEGAEPLLGREPSIDLPKGQ